MADLPPQSFSTLALAVELETRLAAQHRDHLLILKAQTDDPWAQGVWERNHAAAAEGAAELNALRRLLYLLSPLEGEIRALWRAKHG